MNTLLHSKVVHLALALLAFFVPLAVMFKPYQLYMLTGSVLLCTSITAVFSYWPVVRYTMKVRVTYIDKTDALTLGIILLFSATAFREAYVTFWREFYPLEQQRPSDYFYPLSFARYVGCVAAIMSLCARHMDFGPARLRRLPGWPASILSILAGLILGAAMLLR